MENKMDINKMTRKQFEDVKKYILDQVKGESNVLF